MIIFSKPPERPKEEDIFIDDVDMLVKTIYPSYEGQHKLFEKFGLRTGGVCDIWMYTDDWEDLPEIDKWKYVALCSLYWQKQYEYWYGQKEYEEYKQYLQEQSKHNPQFLKKLRYLEYLENKKEKG